MELKPGMKVKVVASDEQLEAMGMDNENINNNLRKFESTISEKLNNAKCKDEDGNEHDVFVLDSTFTMPGMYLKQVDYKKPETPILKSEKISKKVSENIKLNSQEEKEDKVQNQEKKEDKEEQEEDKEDQEDQEEKEDQQ